MKVSKTHILSMWGRLLRSIISADSQGNNSPSLDFYTKQVIPCEFDEKSLQFTLYASSYSANQLEENFGTPSDNPYYKHASYLLAWIKEEQENYEGRCIKLHYFITDNIKSQVDKDAYANILSYMPQLRNNVNSTILGEEFFEEVKRKKGTNFDAVIARNAPSIYKQSNKFTRVKVGLTMTQKKTLNYLIWKYQNTELFQTNLWGEVSMTVSLKELQECGCGANVKQIMNSLTNLGKDTWMQFVDENTGKMVSATMFNRFDATEGSKTIDVTFSPTMTSFVNKLATLKEYSIVDRDAQAAMRSYATSRMYELCCQFRYSDKFIFQIKDEELRRILNCEEKYLDPNDFKRKILQEAKKELEQLYENGKSDLYFDFAVRDKKSKDVKDTDKNGNPSKYQRKQVVSWVFVIKRGPADFAFVKNDSLEEKKKYVEMTIREILACYITDDGVIESLMARARKMGDKDRFDMARDLQSNIRELSMKGEKVIYDIMDKYRFKNI